MTWDWLQRWPRGLRIGVKWRFRWTGAERDQCGRCRLDRRDHGGADHHFVEKEK